jgi:O-antigen/teichoic acid export membrane protein
MLQLLQSLLSVTMQAELRFGWVSVTELLRQVVNVSLIVILVLAGAGILPLLAVAVPASAISLFATMRLVRGYVSLRPSFHAGRSWRLLRESLPWAVVSAVYIVYFRVSIVIMSIVASAQETGYFATSFRITEVLVAIPGLVIGAAFPILVRAARDDPQRFEYASSRIFALALLAGIWLVLCLEVGAPFAIHVLAGNKADPAISVLRIQGAAIIASFASVACGYPLLTMHRFRPVVISSLVALLVSAGLTLALAPSHGARGAAIAALIAEVGLALAQAVILKRTLPGVSLSYRSATVAAIAGGIGALVGVLLPVHPLIGVLIASTIYLALLKALGSFPPEVGEILARRSGTPMREDSER